MHRTPVRVLGVVAAVILEVAVATPAWAHSGVNPNEQLRSELISAPAGLEVQVTSDGSLISVRPAAGSPAHVTVLGYQGEPFLRFAGEQAFTNAESLTTYDVTPGLLTTIPATAGRGGVVWRPAPAPGWFAWADHRIVWTGTDLPADVMDDPGHAHTVSTWSIPVVAGTVTTAITGRVEWVPPTDSVGLTVAVCLGLVAAVVLAGVWLSFSPRRREP